MPTQQRQQNEQAERDQRDRHDRQRRPGAAPGRRLHIEVDAVRHRRIGFAGNEQHRRRQIDGRRYETEQESDEQPAGQHRQDDAIATPKRLPPERLAASMAVAGTRCSAMVQARIAKGKPRTEKAIGSMNQLASIV